MITFERNLNLTATELRSSSINLKNSIMMRGKERKLLKTVLVSLYP